MDISYRNMLSSLLTVARRRTNGGLKVFGSGVPYTGNLQGRMTINGTSNTLLFTFSDGATSEDRNVWAYSFSLLGTRISYVIGLSNGRWTLSSINWNNSSYNQTFAIADSECYNPYQTTYTIQENSLGLSAFVLEIPFNPMWSFDGSSWKDDGQLLSLAPGRYSIVFKDVENYVKPSSQTVTIGRRQAVEVTGEYIPLSFPSALLVEAPTTMSFTGTYICSGNTLEDFYGVYSVPGGVTFYLHRITDSNDKSYWVISSTRYIQPDIYDEETGRYVTTIYAYAQTDLFSLPTQVEWTVRNSPVPLSVTALEV